MSQAADVVGIQNGQALYLVCHKWEAAVESTGVLWEAAARGVLWEGRNWQPYSGGGSQR